eukprot:scaffold5323_cov136-Skeletonema_marinoi.AAC.1
MRELFTYRSLVQDLEIERKEPEQLRSAACAVVLTLAFIRLNGKRVAQLHVACGRSLYLPWNCLAPAL